MALIFQWKFKKYQEQVSIRYKVEIYRLITSQSNWKSWIIIVPSNGAPRGFKDADLFYGIKSNKNAKQIELIGIVILDGAVKCISTNDIVANDMGEHSSHVVTEFPKISIN